MKKNIYVLVVLFLISCNQKKDDHLIPGVITVDMLTTVERPFDDLIEEIDCIPLQKAEGCLDDCWKMISYKEYYYFYSLFDFSVLIYDHDGLFIKCIDSRGKGKITHPTDILVNKEKNELWICESYKSIQKYSLTGDFLECVQLPLFNIKMEFVNNKELLVYSDVFDNSRNKLFHLLQTDTYAVKDSFINKDEKKHPTARVAPSLFVTDKVNNVLYALLEKRNMIYKYDTNRKNLEPYIYLDFKGEYFTEDMYPENGFSDKETNDFLKKNEYIRDIVGVQAISGNIFFYTLGKVRSFFSVDVKNNTVFKYLSLFDGFTPRNINSPISGADEKYLYMVLGKDELLDYYTRETCKYKKVFDDVFSGDNKMDWNNAVVRVRLKEI